MSYLGAQNSIALGVQGLIHIDTGGGAGGSAGYSVNKSLRFRSSASAYLGRTPSVTGSQTTWTWSGWFKRGALGFEQEFLAGGTNGTVGWNRTTLGILSSDKLYFGNQAANFRITTQVFRDPSAWYHLIAVFDSSNATDADRIRLYINGTQVTAFDTNASVPINTASAINSTTTHQIGWIAGGGGALFFDGEMAEVNFVDGQALAPTSFGAFSTYNQWLPKAYTGTYGTNGFYLPFTNTTSTSTLVADSSPNGNNWTPNNISLTAGSTYDSLTDVPTLTSATVANYPVWNILRPSQMSGGTATISNGNLTAADAATSSGIAAQANVAVSSGKWYWEVTATTVGGLLGGCGIRLETLQDVFGLGYFYYSDGNKTTNINGGGLAYGASYTSGNVLGVALDLTAGTLEFYKNNVSQGIAYTGLSGLFSACVGDGQNATRYEWNINFGQQPFVYTPPSGFVALNTYNIAAGTVTTSGTFTGNLSTDGPMVYLNGTPTAMTINGNAVTFGTQADKLANGFKVRSSSASYNTAGSNTYVATTVGAVFKYEDAQSNP